MRLVYDKTNLKQLAFIRDLSRLALFCAGRGSGKTFAGSIKAIRHLCIPGSVGMIVCPTYKHIAIAQDVLFQIMHDMQFTPEQEKALSRRNQKGYPSLVKSYNKKDFDLVSVLGSKIHFRSGDEPDALRGYNLNWAWIDEPALVAERVLDNVSLTLRRTSNQESKPNQEILRASTLPAVDPSTGSNPSTAGDPSTIGDTATIGNNCAPYRGTDGVLPNQLWLTTTPKGFTWLYDRLPEFSLFTATTFDNRDNLPSEFLDNLPPVGTPWYAQEVLGEFIELEGLVFGGHYRVSSLPLGNSPVVVAGLDFGYAVPSAVVWLTTLPLPDGGKVVYVIDELYQSGLTTDVLYSAIKRREYRWLGDETMVGRGASGEVGYQVDQPERLVPERGIKYFADPSGAEFIASLREMGLLVVRGNNQLDFGINQILSTPLVINPRCVNLLSELERYSFGPNSKPVGGYDHAIDALRYAVCGLAIGRVQLASIPWFDTDPALWRRMCS